MSGEVIHATGDLFATVPGVPTNKGVAMNPPPAEYIGDVTRMVNAAMATMPEDGRGQLVGIANINPVSGKLDVNAALAVRAGSRVDIVAWFGKSWGEPVHAGVMGRLKL